MDEKIYMNCEECVGIKTIGADSNFCEAVECPSHQGKRFPYIFVEDLVLKMLGKFL